jgi:hypothetical protein
MGKFDVTMRGGLGNQFFIFSAAIYVSKLTGKIPVFDFLDARAGVANHGNSIEGYLQKLGYKTKLRPKNLLLAKIFVVLRHRQSLFSRKLGLNRGDYLHLNPGWVGDLGEMRTAKGPLSGYFASYKYAFQARDELLELWSEIVDSCPTGARFRNEFSRSRVLGLHARRGDYLTTAKGIGAIDFEAIIESGSSILNQSNVMVFSDDMGFVDAMSRRFENISKIPDELQGASDIDQMVALSGSKSLVISNSTFSWWAAFFSRNAVVYAPDPWCRTDDDPIEILPPDWKRFMPIWLD